MLAGCVSSTTGTPAREADNREAAEFNYQLGQQYFQKQSYELALDRLQRAIELDPRSAKSQLMLGMTYDALQNERLARQSYDEAIRIANDTPYGLSGYVSCADLDAARRIASRLRTGMVHINGAFLDSAAPFGGYKQSGNGREWGRHGIDEFLELKSVYGYEKRQTQ